MFQGTGKSGKGENMGHNGKSSPYVRACDFMLQVQSFCCDIPMYISIVVITPARNDEDLKIFFAEELLAEKHNINLKTSEFVLYFFLFVQILYQLFMAFHPSLSFFFYSSSFSRLLNSTNSSFIYMGNLI